MKTKFFRKVLSNGLTIVFEKRESPAVSMAFAVRAGGINESGSERGIYHFIEHLIYKGTKNRSHRQIAEEIEKKGGVLNGFTSETVTAYWCKMPMKHVDVGLEILSDMVKNPLFEEKEILKERMVILEEMKMYKDSPSHYVVEEIHKLLYAPPFGNPLIGNEKTLNSIDRKKIINKFNQIYRPENMIICVVGNTDFKKIIDFAKKTFPDLKKKRSKIKKSKVMRRSLSKFEKRKGVDQENVVFGYHVPNSKSKKNYAARVLNTLMAGGMSSRLFHEIREKRNLAYAVKGSFEISKDFGYSIIYVGTKKGNAKKIKKIVVEEFKKVSKELTEKELNQVKEELVGNLQISMEDSVSQMSYLLGSEIEGDSRDFYKLEDNIRKVRLRDVKSLASDAARKHSFFALTPH